MKVALLNPPSEKGYIRSCRWTRKSRARQNWYPLWISYACALLQREGHVCLLLDASVEGLNEPQTLVKLFNFQPDLIAYYWGYDTYKRDLQFADSCVTIAKVILVGPWSFCLPNALDFTKRVNLMTYGEFEHTLLEIVEKTPFYSINPFLIKGLIWRENSQSEYVVNERRSLCSSEELDKIPFVSIVLKEFINPKKYRQTSLKYPFTEIQGSRGCPYHCIYCTSTRALQDGPSYRVRSTKNVAEELWWIKNNLHGIKQVFFQDEALIPKRAKELSQTILDEGLKICWGGLARGDLDYETLKLMEEAGCRTLHIGFEKPIQKTLNIIHKDITVERYEQFCHDINRTKIWNNAAFMIFPWETEEEIRFTLQWAKKMKIERMSFIAALSYPNTPYTAYLEELEQKGTKLMSFKEMRVWENWAHKQYYLYHPWMWKQILKQPSNWGNVLNDAKGLLGSLR